MLINDLGATTMMELLIVCRQVGAHIVRERAAGPRYAPGELLHQPGDGRLFDLFVEAGRGIEGLLRHAGPVAQLRKGGAMSSAQLTIEETRQMLLFVARKFIENQDVLTQADRLIGDGDHGVVFARGFESVCQKLGNSAFGSLDELFNAAGMVLLTSIGGASGAILAPLLVGRPRAEGTGDFGCRGIGPVFTGVGCKSKERGKKRGIRPCSMCWNRLL